MVKVLRSLEYFIMVKLKTAKTELTESSTIPSNKHGTFDTGDCLSMNLGLQLQHFLAMT